MEKKPIFNILVIEDEDATRFLCETLLAQEGYGVTAVSFLEQGREQLSQGKFDLILLDLNLPDADGIQLAMELSSGSDSPQILMMTARNNVEDRWSGFEAGAHDYMVKPFHPGELLHRVRNLADRASPHVVDTPKIQFPYCLFDRDKRCLETLGGDRIDLTQGEFKVLNRLISADGHPVSREALLADITDGEREGNWRTVDVLISRLRRKLDPEETKEKLILSVQGFGYRLS